MLSVGMTQRVNADANAWTALGPSGGLVNKVVFNPSSPTTVYAIAGPGFYRSTDGGASWQLTATGSLNQFTDLEIDPSNPNRVYLAGADNSPPMLLSTDGGVTFSNVAGYSFVDGPSHLQISGDGSTLYATSVANVYRSGNRAQSWQSMTAVLAGYPYGPVQQLLIDPNNPNLLYATVPDSATTVGLFRSTDGAASWQSLSSLPTTATTYGLAIAPDSSKLWAARGDGVWVSTDSGQTWTNAHFAPAAVAITLDPSNANTIYTADGAGYVYRSADSGNTWARLANNIAAGTVTGIAVNPSASAQILVSGYAGLQATTTTGASWQASQAGILATNIIGLGADPAGDRIYAAAETNGVFYSAAGAPQLTATNNAALQQLINPQPYWFLDTLQVQSGGRLLVALDNGLASSSDGGTSWATVPLFTPDTSMPTASAFASSPQAPDTILAAYDPSPLALFRSTDGGNSWVSSASGLPSGASVALIQGSASDANTFYLNLSVNLPLYALYRSGDAGVTWTLVGAPLQAVAFAIDPTTALRLFASTFTNLYRSEDGGNSWTMLPWPVGGGAMAFAIDPLHPQIVYAVGYGPLARSIDSGMTWQQLPQPAGAAWSGAVQLDPNRPYRLLAGTAYSGAYEISIEPDLSVDVSGPGGIGIGSSATFHYTVTNNGPYDATGAVLTLQLSTNVSHTSATPSVGTCAVSTAQVTCNLSALRTGTSATVDLKTTPTAAGTLTVTGSVQADQPDPIAANNRVRSNTAVTNPSSVGGGGGGGGGGGTLDGLSILALLCAVARHYRLRRSSNERAAAENERASIRPY
jgi:uncharacterized repeat protein (TIGR01451 family)